MPEKFVVSRRRAGLGDCIISMLGAWYYAKISGRTLVVDWRFSRYLKNKKQNAFAVYFEPVSEIDGVPIICDDTVETLKLPSPTYTALKQRGNLKRLIAPLYRPSILQKLPYLSTPILHVLRQAEADEATLINSRTVVSEPTIIFNACLPIELPESLCQKFLASLTPHRDIQEEIDRYAATYFSSKKVIAVHVRHGNGGNMMAHAKYWVDENRAITNICRAIEKLQTVLGSDGPVFLCTDSRKILRILSARLPHAIVRHKYLRPNGCGELHDRSVVYKKNSTNLGRDAIIEMFLLAQVEGLVCYPPDSYFSFYARHCPNNPQMRYADEFIDAIP